MIKFKLEIDDTGRRLHIEVPTEDIVRLSFFLLPSRRTIQRVIQKIGAGKADWVDIQLYDLARNVAFRRKWPWVVPFAYYGMFTLMTFTLVLVALMFVVAGANQNMPIDLQTKVTLVGIAVLSLLLGRIFKVRGDKSWRGL